ncbi:hypothetical protein Bca4012_064076 [Brassica carinata]
MEEQILPQRIFAFGEEPSGQRVNSYHKMKRTKSIIEAVEPDEVTYLRNSTFDAASTEQSLAKAKFVLVPGHARDLDLECKVAVRSILDDPQEEWALGKDFSWDDETEDIAVDTLVRLIQDCYAFKREMFKGGLTVADISRLRVEKQKEKEAKEKQDKEKQDRESSEGNDVEILSRINTIANLVAAKVIEELTGAENRVMASIEGHIESVLVLKTKSENVIQSILDFLRNPISSTPSQRAATPSASVSDESTSEESQDPPQQKQKGSTSA